MSSRQTDLNAASRGSLLNELSGLVSGVYSHRNALRCAAVRTFLTAISPLIFGGSPQTFDTI